MTQDDPAAAVLVFTHGRTYGPLRGLRAHRIAGEPDLDAAIGPFPRLVVVGADADLAAVLTRLLRAERLDVEVA